MSWAHVQGTGVQCSGPVTSLSVSFVSAVTAGDMVVAAMATYQPNQYTAMAFSDNKSNSWTWDTTNELITEASGIAHSVTTTGGSSFQVTWTPSPATNPAYTSICIDEFSFTGTTSVDSVGNNQTGTSTKTPSVGTTLTVTGTDLIYAVVEFDLYSAGGTTTFSPASGFTNAYTAQWDSGGGEGIWAMYQLNATSGVNPGWTLTSSNTPPTTCCAVAYFGTGGGAAAALIFPPFPSLPSTLLAI